MAVLTSVLLTAALVLAVVVGPQTRPWPWGPAMLALALACAAALPVLWRHGRRRADFALLGLAALTAGWFAWRTFYSPVAELARADLLLLAGAVAAFVAVRGIEGNRAAERVLWWGIALLLAANVGVVAKQLFDPAYTPVFRSRAAGLPSGFFAHYNEAANYLLASALMLAGAAVFARESGPVRAVWGAIALGGLGAVYFTGSRGGILGAAAGGMVLAAAALIAGKRHGAKWFTPALIAVPLVGILLGWFLLSGWQNAQDLRQQGDIAQMFDNNSRLYFMGVALSCIALHPLAGGGSRSFSWESFRFFDVSLQGDMLTHKPEQVHNELLQAATDYGLAGAALVLALLGSLAIVALVRVAFSPLTAESRQDDAWRIGGLAALAGMAVQSSFSFVFHLMPGVILLGICLALLARAAPGGGRAQVIGARVLLSAAAVLCLVALIPHGWKGSRLTRILWPAYFSKIPVQYAETRIHALTQALAIWPQSSLFLDRAVARQTAAMAAAGKEAAYEAGLAIRDYEAAEALHPYDPNPAINRANLLSELGRDEEAELAYDRAIRLQGGMEPGFRGHYSLARHLMRKAGRQFNPQEPEPVLETMEAAAREMAAASREMHWLTPEMNELRVVVLESLGAAREANGDYASALEAYDTALKLPGGRRANFRAGILYGKMAAASWAARKPGEAMGYFMEAKRRVSSGGSLPRDLTETQVRDYLDYLDRTLDFLHGAKVVPVPVE